MVRNNDRERGARAESIWFEGSAARRMERVVAHKNVSFLFHIFEDYKLCLNWTGPRFEEL